MKIIEKLKTAPTGKRVALSHRFEYNQRFDTSLTRGDAIEIRSELTFGIFQIVNDSREIIHADRKAKIALARELYGEVIDRLLSIREQLWENGPHYDDKILKSVEELIGDLTP